MADKQPAAQLMKPDQQHKGALHHHPDKENIPPSAHEQLSCCPAGGAPFFGSGKSALCEPAAAAKRRPLQDITALMAQASGQQQSRQQAPTGASLQKSLWGAGAGGAGGQARRPADSRCRCLKLPAAHGLDAVTAPWALMTLTAGMTASASMRALAGRTPRGQHSTEPWLLRCRRRLRTDVHGIALASLLTLAEDLQFFLGCAAGSS